MRFLIVAIIKEKTENAVLMSTVSDSRGAIINRDVSTSAPL
jgi:hypothetical protein